MKAGIKIDTRENRDMLSTGLIKVEGLVHKIEDGRGDGGVARRNRLS